MTDKPYGLVCPITHACEVVEPRWTLPILSEMWAGKTRFNDIRRHVGSISPALLSRRLKELEENGLIERIEDPATGTVDYIRTQAAIDLEPAMNALAVWAQKNIKARAALGSLDVSTLMWKMHGYLLTEKLPQKQIVIQFRFDDPDLEYNTYWALIRPGKAVEMCTDIPGFDVDLYVETSKFSLTSVILARSTVAREQEAGRMFLSGDALLARTMQDWLYVTTYGDCDENELLEGDATVTAKIA